MDVLTAEVKRFLRQHGDWATAEQVIEGMKLNAVRERYARNALAALLVAKIIERDGDRFRYIPINEETGKRRGR